MKKFIILILIKVIFVSAVPIQRENLQFQCSFTNGDHFCLLKGINVNVESSDLLDVGLNTGVITTLSIEDSIIPKLNLTNICLALPNLARILISHQSIEEITPDSLNECRNVLILKLYGNKIKKLDVNLFKNNEKLLNIGLAANELRTFDFLITKNLKNLGILTLENNKLHNLDVDLILDNSPRLRNLNLQDNDFECSRLKEIIKKLISRKMLLNIFSYEDRKRDYTPQILHGFKCLSADQYDQYVLNSENYEDTSIEIQSLKEAVKYTENFDNRLEEKIDKQMKKLSEDSKNDVIKLKKQINKNIDEVFAKTMHKIEEIEDKLTNQSDMIEKNAEKIIDIQNEYDKFVKSVTYKIHNMNHNHQIHQKNTNQKIDLLKTEMIDLFSQIVNKNQAILI